MGEKRPPLWYHGWNVVAVCMMCSMSGIALTLSSFSLFLPSWIAEFDAPVSSIALAVTIFSVGTAAFSYLIGHWAGRHPARWLFGGGLVALGLSHLAMAMVESLWQMVAIYALVLPLAIGCSAAIPSQSLVSRWFVRRAGLAMGLTAAGLALAGIVFPPIVVLALPLVGWRAIWAGFGIIILVVILPIAMLILRDRPADDDPFDYVVRRDAGAAAVEAVPLRTILRSRNFWLLIAAFLCVQCVALSVSVTIGPILLLKGASAAEVGLFLATYGGSALVAKLLSGWLADRIGNHLPIVVATLGAAIGIGLLVVPSITPSLLIATALIAGLSGAIWTLLASSILVEFGAASFSRAFGFACALSPVGTFAPPMAAKVAEVTGAFDSALAALAGVTLAVALAVLVFFRQPDPRALATGPV